MSNREEDELPTALLMQMDSICDRFEAACQQGQIPDLEAILREAPAEIRELLQPELLEIQEHYRERAEWNGNSPGESPLSGISQANKPDVTIPGYRIVDELGRGAMGVVYKAWHLETKRVVALKMIPTRGPIDKELLARFRTEAEVMSLQKHPNIIRVYEVGQHRGNPYIVMEFCPGGTLFDRLKGEQTWPPREAAQLIETLARAIQTAHDQRIIHRDLKPGNILMASPQHPKITDFGLAKNLDAPGFTAMGRVIGTPCYMAPEQATGETHLIGPATDVYALGAILYHLLAGHPPFSEGSRVEIIRQVVQERPIPLRSLDKTIPRELEGICLQCLQKEPHHRYLTAVELANDLAQFLEARPFHTRLLHSLRKFFSATPARPWRERWQRFTKR